MDIHFSIFELLVLIGVIQGLIISLLIWFRKSHSQRKLLLSFVLLVFTFLCIKILILQSGLWNIPYLRYIPLSFDLAIQPLIYWYILSLTRPGFHFKKQYLVQLFPFALSFAYSLFIYGSVLSLHSIALKDQLADHYSFNMVKEIEDYLSVCSSLVYWFLGLRQVLRYRRWLYNNISDTNFPTYGWLRNISLLMGILIVGLAIDILLDYFFRFGIRHFFHWQLFFIYLSVLIYYMGFRGYQLPDAAEPKEVPPMPIDHVPSPSPRIETPLSHSSPILESVSPDPMQRNAPTIPPGMDDPRIRSAILKALETDKVYLDPELSLQSLSAKLTLSPAVVSAVINSEWKKSFRTLINDYRVEAVKSMMQGPKVNQLSILGIAYECGFNSEASFYRIFKASVGLSPKEYLRTISRENDSQNIF